MDGAHLADDASGVIFSDNIAAVTVIAVLCLLFADILKAEHSGVQGALAALEKEIEETVQNA